MLSHAMVAVGLDIGPVICMRCCKRVLSGGGSACGEGMVYGSAGCRRMARSVVCARRVLCDGEGAGEGFDACDAGTLVCRYKRGGREMLG